MDGIGRIGCRQCEETRCNGCNLFILETMLRKGDLDRFMDDRRTIDPYSLRVAAGPVEEENWLWRITAVCPECGAGYDENALRFACRNRLPRYCPNCGKNMEGAF